MSIIGKITFGKPESWTMGTKSRTTKADILLDGQIVGEIVGKSNPEIPRAMFWAVEMHGKRPVEVRSYMVARFKAQELLAPALPAWAKPGSSGSLTKTTTPTLDAEISKLQPRLGQNHKIVADHTRLKREHGAMKTALAALVERYGPSFGYSGDQRDELANAELILSEVDKP